MGVGGVIEIIQHFQVHTHIQLCGCFGFSPTLELTPQHTPSSSIAAQFHKVTRYCKCVTENMATLEHGQADSVPSTNYTYTLLCDQDAACPLLQPSAPTQPIYQQPQPAATQPQPPPQTGVQYHLQPYPAVSEALKYSNTNLCGSFVILLHLCAATSGLGPASAAKVGATAENSHKIYGHFHQAPQVCLCDQCGDYHGLHSIVLAARVCLSCTSCNT